MPTTIDVIQTLTQIAVGLGVVTAAAHVWIHYRNRRRWRAFKNRVAIWLRSAATLRSDHPKGMSRGEWQALCEELMQDCSFNPFETVQLLDLAVVTAKRIVRSQLV